MTNWTREFIQGRTVYVIRADAGDLMGAANAVYQLLPMLLTGEEIRIRPAVKESDQPRDLTSSYDAESFTPQGGL